MDAFGAEAAEDISSTKKRTRRNNLFTLEGT